MTLLFYFSLQNDVIFVWVNDKILMNVKESDTLIYLYLYLYLYITKN